MRMGFSVAWMGASARIANTRWHSISSLWNSTAGLFSFIFRLICSLFNWIRPLIWMLTVQFIHWDSLWFKQLKFAWATSSRCGDCQFLIKSYYWMMHYAGTVDKWSQMAVLTYVRSCGNQNQVFLQLQSTMETTTIPTEPTKIYEWNTNGVSTSFSLLFFLVNNNDWMSCVRWDIFQVNYKSLLMSAELIVCLVNQTHAS